MFLLFVYIVLIFWGLVKPKSRISFGILAGYLWFLFGWSYGNADWMIYVNRYNNYESLSSHTEWLFTFCQKVGHLIHLDYRMYLILVSGICLCLIYKTILDLSQRPAMVLALYAVFCFPIDVTQVRFFMAFAIAVFGFRYMFAYIQSRQRKDLVKWCLCVFFASGIHMAIVVVLLYLIPILWGNRIAAIVMLVTNILLITLSTFQARIFALIGYFLGSEKESLVMSKATQYNLNTIKFVWFKTLFIFVGFLVCYWLITYLWSVKKIDTSYQNKGVLADVILGVNFITMIVIGLITVTTDFYRVQQVTVFLNYIFYSCSMYPAPKSRMATNKLNFVLTSIMLLFAVGALYNLVLRTTNYETVFIPLFYNNVLFN